jgi:hypothetical protein
VTLRKRRQRRQLCSETQLSLFASPATSGSATRASRMTGSAPGPPRAVNTGCWTFEAGFCRNSCCRDGFRIFLQLGSSEDAWTTACPEFHLCGIPQPCDQFRAIDDRRLKRFILQAGFSDDTPDNVGGVLCMWRTNMVKEYSRRQLTYVEEKLIAETSITSKIALRISDECVLGIWRQDPVPSLPGTRLSHLPDRPNS